MFHIERGKVPMNYKVSRKKQTGSVDCFCFYILFSCGFRQISSQHGTIGTF